MLPNIQLRIGYEAHASRDLNGSDGRVEDEGVEAEPSQTTLNRHEMYEFKRARQFTMLPENHLLFQSLEVDGRGWHGMKTHRPQNCAVGSNVTYA
jgi:hypothetical protein